MSYHPKVQRRGDGNFFKVYRPLRFDELIGDTFKVSNGFTHALDTYGTLENQSYLFVGDSGSGKTTLALILGLAMNCENPIESRITGEKIEPCLTCNSCRMALAGGTRNSQFSSVSVWNSPTINKEQISDIVHNSILSPKGIGTKVTVNIFDEAHLLTKDQKSVLLNPLESLPRHSYVFLTTNMESELNGKRDAQTKAVLSRFTKVKLPSWNNADLLKLLTDVAYTEVTSRGKHRPLKETLEYLVEASEGNARSGLNMLQHLMDSHKGEEKIIPVSFAKETFSVMGDGDFVVKNKANLKPIFSAFYNGNTAMMISGIQQLEKDRVPPVETIYSINKFLKNRVYQFSAEGQPAKALAFSTKLQRFSSIAIPESNGEPYARLLIAAIRAISK